MTNEIKHIWGIDDFVTGITNYTYECYDWRGSFITLQEDWTWRNYSCWHCSCYGPLEHWYSWNFTADEMIKLVENMDSWDVRDWEQEELIVFINENRTLCE